MRLLSVGAAAILGALAAVAIANDQVTSITLTPGAPGPGQTVTVAVNGTSDPNSRLLLNYATGDCSGGAETLIALHSVSGPFTTIDTFTTPLAEGTYCLHAAIETPPSPSGSTASSDSRQSFTVAGTTTPATPVHPPTSAGTQRPGSTSSHLPLALAAIFHRVRGAALDAGGLLTGVHLRAPATARIDVLLGASAARRLGIAARPDGATDGRYVVLRRDYLGRLKPGWHREHLGLPGSTAARLKGAGKVGLVARIALAGADGTAQSYFLHLLISA